MQGYVYDARDPEASSPRRPMPFTFGAYGRDGARAALVVQPSGASDVVVLFAFAKRHHLRISVFSTGIT